MAATGTATCVAIGLGMWEVAATFTAVEVGDVIQIPLPPGSRPIGGRITRFRATLDSGAAATITPVLRRGTAPTDALITGTAAAFTDQLLETGMPFACHTPELQFLPAVNAGVNNVVSILLQLQFPGWQA